MHRILPLFAVFCLFFLGACQDVAEVSGCKFEEGLEGYTLVWSDEFEGTDIDDSKWSFELGDGCDVEVFPCLGDQDQSVFLCGWGNNELQYYTDRTENARLENGNLIIEAQKELPFFQGQHQYTSARMVTKNKAEWTFGRIDVRAKLPAGQGLWPATWMLPTDVVYGSWPCSGEIDIMENIGSEPNRVFGTIHYGNEAWEYNSQYYELEDGTFADDFHVFTVLWNNDCIQFQVDGKDVGVPNTRSTTYPQTYPFDQPFHMILNVAVGGNLPGNPSPSTVFPQRLEVDYVRVYQ